MLRDPDAHSTIDIQPLTQDAERGWVAVVSEAASWLVELPEGRELSVGRSRSSGIRIDHDAVSRLHATLRWDGGDRLTVTDQRSRNGTLVDGRRVAGSTQLASGALVEIGPATLSPILPTPALPSPRELGLVAEDVRSQTLLVALRRFACTKLPILLVGETGVGKEKLARYAHRCSPRASQPFVAINCGAIPEALAEAALFGHERGAFTGAEQAKPGVFEAADGGTLLLDEVGELSPASQARLLRTLESGELLRVGAVEPVHVDVRVLAATHLDLDAAAASGRFRSDLLYRLDVLRLEIPPLRERPDDILPLAEQLLGEIAGGAPRLSEGVAQALRNHSWPGNVRELRNVLARAAALSGSTLEVRDLELEHSKSAVATQLDGQVNATERAAIMAALKACAGNQSAAARRLGITRRALIYRLEKHGLKPAPKRRASGPSRGEVDGE